MPWLPMDVTTRALLDIVLSPKPLEPSYNLVHPRPISFSKIIGFVQRSLASTTGVKLSFVPFKDWMARLEDAARRPGVSARDVVSIHRARIGIYIHVCPPPPFVLALPPSVLAPAPLHLPPQTLTR